MPVVVDGVLLAEEKQLIKTHLLSYDEGKNGERCLKQSAGGMRHNMLQMSEGEWQSIW